MSTWILIIGLVGAIGVGVAYYTGTIRWYVAVPAVLGILLLAMAAQAANAQANTRVRLSTSAVECHSYSVTEYRNGVVFGSELWHLNQRLSWCQVPPSGPVWEGPVVHRSHGTNAFWVFNDYQTKTKVKKLLNPTRWQVYVKAAFTGSPDFYGIAEHNYPWIRMTIWKKNWQHVAYTASCGC
jgi:hypothetical protein